MRRRLDLAASLVVPPRVLFLDEPTTGLDPRSRNQLWQAVRTLVHDGTTVVLTTQYLEEADQLADRISVMDAGRVVAEGTSDDLKSKIGGDRLEVVVHDAAELDAAEAIVRRVCGATTDRDMETRRLSAPVTDRVTALAEVMRELLAAGIGVEDIALRRPTLDEAFLQLTADRSDRRQRSASRAPDMPYDQERGR